VSAENALLVPATVRFLSGPLAGSTIFISKPITTIGRNPSNDIVIKDDQKVSRQHARLLWSNGTWFIEKYPQTASPLFVNNQSVQQAVLTDRAIIGLGDDTSFQFFIATRGQERADVNLEGRLSQTPPIGQQPTPSKLTPVSTTPAMPGSPPAARQMQRPDATQIAQLPPQAGGTVISPLSATGLPSLEVSDNTSALKQTHTLTKDVINLGRDATNDIAINDRIVSGQHLRIVRQGNSLVLIHPNPDNPRGRTLNGLLYQGRKIRGDEQFSKVLINGDIFRIGDENGTLVTLTYSDGTGAPRDTVPPVQPIKLTSAELTIGRAADNTLVLAHPQVSAHHARLVREGGTYRILDLNSTNHVYVNSELATSHLLKLGDEIRIGPYRLVYEANQLTQYDESNFIRIDAQNLKKTGNNNVVLLNNISVVVPPRKFVALVGGSGAGKSTLMDALNGLRPAREGKVLYNGQDYYHNIAAFSTQLGYVPQDDIVHRDLTVERALYYAAKLRLPGDFTNEQIEQRIKEVLEDVEMTGRRKLLVKKLSGGQRKRVSIALELLANPSIFFLDEPTSGLDPGLDRKMMYLLRKLADKGHTIVLVTHATNNINTCDYVCFLAQGGRLAYFGPPDEAKAFFGKNDFAEIYTSLEPTDEQPNAPEDAEARYKLSKEYQEYIAQPMREVPGANGQGLNGRPKEIKRAKRGNPFKQFALLSRRNFELLRNDRSTLILLLLQAPLLALLLTLLIRMEVGTGIFNANNEIQCSPRIFAASAVSATNPNGLIGIQTNGGNALVDCNRIITFLKNDPNGISYAHSKGGVNTALQDFIATSTGGLNAERALFIVAFMAVLFGVLNGTRAIVKEISIYRRERTVNLGIVPYVSSKVFVLGLFALYQSAALLLIVYAFEPFHQGIFLPIVLEAYITVVLAALIGLLSGLAASAFAANEDSANSLIPFLLIPQLVFAGVEIPLKEGILQTAAMFFPMRWAMVALGSSFGLHSDKLGGDALFGSNSTFRGTLFSTFTQTEAMQRVLLAWGVLGLLIVLLFIVVCIGLKRKDVRV
jgi:ABC-type multidrug transport system ATPase subunit/pSer/pThr/pTyr-binding forkhead associated (FHA) protein